ncbi:MAG: peptidylprolyl isomerase [Erysipelotrichaceae bacterium]
MIKGIMLMEGGIELPFELYDEAAPITVANFVKLIKEGYYDGKTFHRVIPHFVSQGGCPNGNGTGDLGYTIPCETSNGIKHMEGALSMAHRGKNTGCCQFFIVHDPQPHLDGVHTVFGKVTDNMAWVKRMHGGEKITKVTLID